ncbi:AP-3 complex subunit mu-1-like isoform X3 [Xenia sp. Carnegie-2017]|uniref:AP-3 complex subunit mu-1-like isoform X3 n=1 Tax=Xenia sp. Carnegie-2017 TaxID=2897299 RepID=UPI001F04F216|nr:AP-3 complex subunit mu-1-like isoform X3 [Xenia sp. Carnegie-2017]
MPSLINRAPPYFQKYKELLTATVNYLACLISTCVLQILISLKMSVFILVFASEDGRVNMLPLFAKPCVLFQEGGSGRFELSISSKPVMGKNIENVVTVPFPKQVLNLNLTTNELSWEIGRIQSQTSSPNIKGNISLSDVPSSSETPTGFLNFKIYSFAALGLKVGRLDVHGECYMAALSIWSCWSEQEVGIPLFNVASILSVFLVLLGYLKRMDFLNGI